VVEQIGAEVDLILDGGRCSIGVESTVLDLSMKPTILRLGGLGLEEIEELIGKVEISPLSKRPYSPGHLPHHYSPRTPLRIIEGEDLNALCKGRSGLLAFRFPTRKLPFEVIEVLSPSGDLHEAAMNLFSSLHRLDDAQDWM
jgi:L-threonylcarbamoyladenylate synthase